MTVTDINGKARNVSSVDELGALLMRRGEDGLNTFILCHDPHGYPALHLFANGELATTYYIRNENDAGFMSIARTPNLDSEGTIRYGIVGGTEGDDVFLSNNLVVPFAVALQVAEEFFHQSELPKSIEWLEL